MLGFVVVHRDFEHVIAANADAVDLLCVNAGLCLFIAVRMVRVAG